MRKSITAALAAVVMLFVAAPATAADQPPCPATATVQTITEGCQLPDYPEAAQPAVGYLVSAFYALQDLLTTEISHLQKKIEAQAETISDQQATIDRQAAQIKRLRHRLHRR